MSNQNLRITFILLAFLTGLAAGPALALDDGADADAADTSAQDPRPHRVTVEESAPHIPRSNTIATRLDISPFWTPFHLGTVNEPVLDDQYALVLGDALKNISGVNPQTQSGIGDQFYLRGFDSVSSGLVLTDGAAEPELSFFQMYNVDRVEVLKGPGGFLYSRNGLSGASAGAVNIVRRQPVPGDFTHLSLSGGSFNTLQGTVDWNATSDGDKFGFRLNALARQSDFYRDDKDNETWAVNPAFTWLVGQDTSINVNLEYLDTEHMPDSGIPLFNGEIADVPRERSYQSPFDTSEQQISRFQVDVETRLSDSWILRNKTYVRDLDWESNGTLFNGVFPNPFTFEDEVSRSLTILDNDQTFLGNQIEAVWSTSDGSVEHQILTGLEVGQYSNEFTLDLGCDPNIFGLSGQCVLPSIDLDEPVETSTTFFRAPIDAGDADTEVVAPYAIYQGRYTEWFQLLAGARLDSVDFEDDLTGDKFDDTDVSPMVGVVFQPTKNLNLYAHAAESFAPPSARVDDPEPEEGRQFEVGAKLESFDGKLVTSVAVFDLERDNIPIADPNGFTQQAGDQESQGFEVEIAAEPLPRLRAFLSYTYTDAELTNFSERVIFGPGPTDFFVVDHSGNDPAFVPEHIVNLWVSKRFTGRWGVGGGGRYVASQFIEEDNAFEIDSYTVFDAAVYYALEDWNLAVNFKNLFDEEYETRGFGGTSVLPGDGFAVYGTVQYSF